MKKVNLEKILFIDNMDIPGPLISTSHEKEQQDFYSKSLLKSAIKISEKLLIEKDYIPEESVKELSSEKAIVMGHEICNRIINMVDDMILVEEEELVLPDEKNIHDSFMDYATMCPLPEALSSSSSSHSSSFSEKWISSPRKRKYKHIDLDKKRKVVVMAKEHPTWSLKTLQKKGASNLKNKGVLNKYAYDAFNTFYVLNSNE